MLRYRWNYGVCFFMVVMWVTFVCMFRMNFMCYANVCFSGMCCYVVRCFIVFLFLFCLLVCCLCPCYMRNVIVIHVPDIDVHLYMLWLSCYISLFLVLWTFLGILYIYFRQWVCDLTANGSDLTPMAVNGRNLLRESRLNLNRMRGPFTDILFLFFFLLIFLIFRRMYGLLPAHPASPYAVCEDVPRKLLTNLKKNLK